MSDDQDASAEESAHLPEASFSILVTQLYTQALIELGVMPNPVTHESKAALPRARFTIDILEVLLEKTRGNLEEPEEGFLQQALYDLRMKFVQASG